ncbi:RNA polymerase sigma factor [Ekhidna sp. To15]|uniref:RNA polymerase sigma factor n=1 Tax=Ekhidna sp. To15 TaxID=3395267 RepID=UPI003F51CB7F
MPNNTKLFESLHADYYAMVHQMCLGFMKGDPDLANDLTQESFINTWRSLDKFKGAASYKTWIYRITVNTCLKYIRDNKQKTQVSIETQVDLASTGDQPTHEQPHQELYHAIGQLNELDRLIIMMVLDELEYDEIASVVGIKEGNLRVKIHRIKKNLKKILENE